MAPDWFRLVKGYRLAPTVPFLVGALRNPRGTIKDAATSEAEFRALFAAMGECRGYSVIPRECSSIKEMVLDPGWEGTAASPWEDGFVDELWIRYGDKISSGLFSLHDGEWCPFSSADLADIELAFVNTEPE